jgi:hypothetical protein
MFTLEYSNKSVWEEHSITQWTEHRTDLNRMATKLIESSVDGTYYTSAAEINGPEQGRRWIRASRERDSVFG